MSKLSMPEPLPASSLSPLAPAHIPANESRSRRRECATGITLPQEVHAFLFGVFVLEVERGHLPSVAPVEDDHTRRAQPPRRIGRVDRCVARADHHDASPCNMRRRPSCMLQ